MPLRQRAGPPPGGWLTDAAAPSRLWGGILGGLVQRVEVAVGKEYPGIYRREQRGDNGGQALLLLPYRTEPRPGPPVGRLPFEELGSGTLGEGGEPEVVTDLQPQQRHGVGHDEAGGLDGIFRAEVVEVAELASEVGEVFHCLRPLPGVVAAN